MDKFLTVFFEGSDGIERELVILGNLGTRAWDGHGSEGFIGFEEVLCKRIGDCDEVGFEVVRVSYEEGRRHDGGKGFVGEIATVREDTLAMGDRNG